MQRTLGCLAVVPVPVVAAISCYALGSGLELALGADRRVIGDNVKLAMPQIRAGLIPRGGGTQRLRALIGPAAASDLMFTGRFVAAAEAQSLGLADEMVAPDEVFSAAMSWARQFRGSDRAALAAVKTALAGDYGTERADIAALLKLRC
jgi:enoyl-CoA hydratase